MTPDLSGINRGKDSELLIRPLTVYGEVKVLLLDLEAKRAWYKINFSNSDHGLVKSISLAYSFTEKIQN